MFKELDFTPGKVVYDDFNVYPNMPFKEQIYSLKQDMFQVDYNDEYVIDIGWRPDFDPKGKFVIFVIKDLDWAKPIYRKQTNNLKRLDKLVEECVGMVKKLL